MPVVEASAVTGLARAAVQKALSTWIADKRLAEERNKQLRELLPRSFGDHLRRADPARQLESLVQAAEAELEQWVRVEMSGLDPGDRSAALMGVIEVFDRADLSDEALFALDFDAGRLADRLRTEFADVKRSARLSEAADGLHDRVLERSCHLFVRTVQRIDAFMPRTLTEVLTRMTDLKELVLTGLRPPERPRRTPPEYWATVREIHARTPKLVGRRAELAEVATFATGRPSYRWLVGDAWAGKTALLAEAVAALPPPVDVVAYFASRREADADGNRFLIAVVPQLEYLLNEDRSSPDPHRLRYLWARAVERAADLDRQLLLVVDGLDEDLQRPGIPSIASLLPGDLGARGHVLVASRPHPELTDYLNPDHPLQKTTQIPLNPSKEARDLATRAKQELHDLLRSEHAELALEVFGVLTAASGPLAVADVAALIENPARVTPVALARVRHLMVEEAARSLQSVGTANRLRYAFAHGELLEQAQAHPDLSHPEYRQRIDRWARAWADMGWPLPAGEVNTTPRYLLDSYPATLKDDRDRLAQLASDVGWVTAALHTVGIDRLLADLSALAAVPETIALVAALRTQATALRPPHPVGQLRYLLRQLCLGALELGEDRLAAAIRARLQILPDPGPVPDWTTRRVSSALIVEFSQDSDSVWALAVLPEGKVVGAGVDGRLRVWDPATPGAVPTELGHHDNTVEALAVAPDGRVISGGDGRVRMWNPAAPNVPTELGTHDDTVQALAVTPDGRVISGGNDRRVRMWNPAAPNVPTELGTHDDTVQALAVTPDGRVISSGCDGRVRMWDPAAPNVPTELGRHDRAVVALAVAPDGRVISGGDDGRVRMWDPAAPNVPTELGRHDDEVGAVAVAPDGRVISSGFYGLVRMWDPAAPNVPTELRRDDEVTTVAVGPDGRVISGGPDGAVRVWDPAAPGSSTELGRHDRAVEAVAVAPDGWVVSVGTDLRLLAWDPSEPGAAPIELGYHNSWVWAVAVAPDGWVVTGGGDTRVWMWDPTALGASTELGRHDAPVRALAVTPDGRVISGGESRRVRMWDPAAPGVPVNLGRHDSAVRAVAVATDGQVVSGGLDGRVRMWDPAGSGADTALGRHDGAVRALAVTPDGRVLSAGQDGRVMVWDPGRRGVAVETASAASDIAVAPGHNQDHARFVIAHDGHGISMWSLPRS
ncbi:MAG: repeat, subgroup [Streptosporangiaceae bacterium]|nr:repeat, subgroup [Streptosporangiaceae bacterium]